MPVTGSWSERARQSVQPIYEQIVQHPFVVQLRSGELERTVFARYLADDAHYLVGFARALAMTGARLPDAADVALLTRAAASSIEAERALHTGWLAEHGIDPDRDSGASPTCQQYISTLLAAAASEPVEVALAAVLPCFRVYTDVGSAIAEHATVEHPYADWIATYSDPEFAAITRDVEAVADRLADQAGAGVRDRMLDAFARSTRLEWMFWDAAWRGERWPGGS